MDAQGWAALSPPGWVMIGVLAVCFFVLVGLVVTLPAVTRGIRGLVRLARQSSPPPPAREHPSRA